MSDHIAVRLTICLGWHSVITVKDLAICHQSVAERKNHQPVHSVLTTMNQEPLLIDHCFAVAAGLPGASFWLS